MQMHYKINFKWFQGEKIKTREPLHNSPRVVLALSVDVSTKSQFVIAVDWDLCWSTFGFILASMCFYKLWLADALVRFLVIGPLVSFPSSHSALAKSCVAFKDWAATVVCLTIAIAFTVTRLCNVIFHAADKRMLSFLTFIDRGRFFISMTFMATLLVRCSIIARTCLLLKSRLWLASFLCCVRDEVLSP